MYPDYQSVFSQPPGGAEGETSDDLLFAFLKPLGLALAVLLFLFCAFWAVLRIAGNPPPDWSSGVDADYASRVDDPGFTRVRLVRLCGRDLSDSYAAGAPDWRFLECLADNGGAVSVVNEWRDRQIAWSRAEALSRLAETRRPA